MIRALPDLMSSSLFSRVTADLRANLDRSALEAVTGQKSDITAATGGRNGQIHRAQMAIADSQAAQTRLALVTGRYTQAAASLATIRQAGDNFATEALQAAQSGSQAGIKTSAQTADSIIGVTINALNTRFDGRSLFAGDEASTNALADVEVLRSDIASALSSASTTADKMAAIDAYFAPGGGFDTNLYQGGSGEAAGALLPGGFKLPPITRGDSQEIRDLLKGLTIISESFKLPPVDIVDWVRQGADLIRTAQEDLTVNEAEIGTSLNRIDEAVQREQDDLLVARETLDRIIGRDAFEAASETQNLEVRLQAAYSLTSRLSRLSLTNYLR